MRNGSPAFFVGKAIELLVPDRYRDIRSYVLAGVLSPGLALIPVFLGSVSAGVGCKAPSMFAQHGVASMLAWQYIIIM